MKRAGFAGCREHVVGRGLRPRGLGAGEATRLRALRGTKSRAPLPRLRGLTLTPFVLQAHLDKVPAEERRGCSILKILS